jgi:hypothetical protein
MDNVRYGVSRSADREMSVFQFYQKRFNLVFIGKKELYVVTAREAQVSVTIGIGDFTDFSYRIR